MKFSFLIFIDAFGEDPQKTFIEKIFPNFWDFLVQFLAFLLLLLIVIKLGYKPVRKLLDERRTYVKNNLEGSLKAKDEALKASETATANIAMSKKEASKIIDEAKKEAEIEREKIITKAKEDASKEKLKAEEDIAQAKIAAKEDIQKEIVDVALKVSTQLLGREVDSKDNEKLIEGFVSSIKEDK